MRKYPVEYVDTAYVDEADIVAIVPDGHDAASIHMRGGSIIRVTEPAAAAYQRATQPAAAQAEVTTTDPMIAQAKLG